MKGLTTCFWMNGNVEEAAKFYASVFKNGNAATVTHHGEAEPHEAPDVTTCEFEISGQKFLLLNGGQYEFNPAISIVINCENQEEVDHYWDSLISGGGFEQPCGWLVDRYGVSWQVIPERLMQLMSDPDREKANKVMQAMLKMTKIEIPILEQAYNG